MPGVLALELLAPEPGAVEPAEPELLELARPEPVGPEPALAGPEVARAAREPVQLAGSAARVLAVRALV